MIGKNGKSKNINNSVILLIDSDFDLSKIKTIKKDFDFGLLGELGALVSIAFYLSG